jgi:membrane-associated protein
VPLAPFATALPAALPQVGPGAVPALLPDWLSAQGLIDAFGAYAFWGVVAVIFAETGLLIGFFLPGDSLLFLTGLLIGTGVIAQNIWLACVVLVVAAFVGNLIGYWIGRKAGPSVFNRPNSRFFKQVYVDKTHAFFERYGGRAIILARFVPIVRTFITVMAGVGKMDFRAYALYSGIGAVLWAGLVTLSGYWLGNIEFVADNIEVILLAFVFVSILPIVFEYVRHRRGEGLGQSSEEPAA